MVNTIRDINIALVLMEKDPDYFGKQQQCYRRFKDAEWCRTHKELMEQKTFTPEGLPI